MRSEHRCGWALLVAGVILSPVAGGCGGTGGSTVGLPGVGVDYCEAWCTACARCVPQNIDEGDCLDNGGPFCRSVCRQVLSQPEPACAEALEAYRPRLVSVSARPDWLTCKTTIDRDHPFDSGVCPSLADSLP